MSERDAKLLVGDILESAKRILDYTKGLSYEQFMDDAKTVDAVVRNFEIIGEASNRLPKEFRLHNTSVDWQRIRGFRNRIIHDYFGIDYTIVWKIKEEFLPQLVSLLTEIKL